jgi:hypothetical protein
MLDLLSARAIHMIRSGMSDAGDVERTVKSSVA